MSYVMPPQPTPKQRKYRKHLIRRLKKRGMFIIDHNHKGGGTYGLLAPHGKMYIGKSVEYKTRMGRHQRNASYKKMNGKWKEEKYLYNAIRKWGWDRFEKFIFEKHDETRADINDIMNAQEIALIAEFETFTDRSKGYNLTAGGEGCSGRKLTPEQRATHAAAVNCPEYKAGQSERSKKMWEDPEYRAKRSVALTEAKNRPEVKAAASAATIKLWKDPEYRTKMKARSKRKSKPVVSKQLVSGKNPIKEYQLRYHASQTTGAEELRLLFDIKIDNSTIGKLIKAKKRSRSGFEFENYSGKPGQPTPERPIKRMRVTNI